MLQKMKNLDKKLNRLFKDIKEGTRFSVYIDYVYDGIDENGEPYGEQAVLFTPIGYIKVEDNEENIALVNKWFDENINSRYFPKKNKVEQNPLIWGEGWYAILNEDDLEDQVLWYVSPKKYFEEEGCCPDGWVWDMPEGMTEDEFEDYVDEHGYEPNPPKGFTYCMESCMECTEDWDLEKQRQILKENGFIVDNVPKWG